MADDPIVKMRMYKDEAEQEVYINAKDLLDWIKEGIETPEINPIAKNVCQCFADTIQSLIDQTATPIEKEEGWDG